MHELTEKLSKLNFDPDRPKEETWKIADDIVTKWLEEKAPYIQEMIFLAYGCSFLDARNIADQKKLRKILGLDRPVDADKTKLTPKMY